jgi:hypothetical protein
MIRSNTWYSPRIFSGLPRRWSGELLPDLGSRVGKHAKGDAMGVKLERPDIRVLNLGQFTKVDDVGDLLDRLFGPV